MIIQHQTVGFIATINNKIDMWEKKLELNLHVV
jgi:hypothetical protein